MHGGRRILGERLDIPTEPGLRIPTISLVDVQESRPGSQPSRKTLRTGKRAVCVCVRVHKKLGGAEHFRAAPVLLSRLW